MTDYSKWDKLDDSDDEATPTQVPAAKETPSAAEKMEVVRTKAHALMEAHKFAEGGELYKDLIKNAPADAPAGFIESCRMNLAIALIKQDLHHEVIPLCTEIITANPDLHKAKHFRGHAFMQMGFLQDAENDLKAAKEAMPGDDGVTGDLAALTIAQEAEIKMKACMEKANAAFQVENLDDTVAFFKEALVEGVKVRRRDMCGAINGSIGMALFKQEKHREAIPHFVQALQDMPHPERRMEFLEALSACHTVLGEGDMCVKALEGAIMIGVQAGAPPQRMVKLLLHAARSCGMLKKTEEGLKYVKKAKEIATAAQQWEIVFQCNEWIARLHTEAGQPDAALSSITEAFQEACARVDLKAAIALMYIQMHVLKITDPIKHINLVQSTHAFFVSQKEFKGVLSCLEVLIVHAINQFKTVQAKDPKHIASIEELWDEVRALPYEPMENEEKFVVLKLLQLQADFYVEFDSKKACKKVLKEMLDLAHAMKPIPPQHVIAEVFKKLTALSEAPDEQLEHLVAVEASLRQFQADVDSRIQTEQKPEILAKIAGDIADTLCNKAYCQAELGQIDASEATLAECQALCTANDIRNGRIVCLTQIATGILALKRGNKEAAETHFAEGMASAETSNDANVIAQVRELVNEAREKGGLPAQAAAPVEKPAEVAAAPKSAEPKAKSIPAKKTYPGAKLKKSQGSSLAEYIPLIVFMLFLAIFFHLVSQ
ncbi:hypothetical protein ACHHYP_16682 [Achlya hypogyna]|uniref:Uncharacterized protein n=1 Tax=Achlya hypogyna TaxID=1202772 RepID=A0A1V9Y653_ACHHY|nr:hypothetical protein ACHHYP_16682 [Achlya hypogyna]